MSLVLAFSLLLTMQLPANPAVSQQLKGSIEGAVFGLGGNGEALARFEQQGKPVRIGESSKQNVEVRIIPAGR